MGDCLFSNFTGLNHPGATGNHDPVSVDLDVHHALFSGEIFGALCCFSRAHFSMGLIGPIGLMLLADILKLLLGFFGEVFVILGGFGGEFVAELGNDRFDRP